MPSSAASLALRRALLTWARLRASHGWAANQRRMRVDARAMHIAPSARHNRDGNSGTGNDTMPIVKSAAPTAASPILFSSASGRGPSCGAVIG